ncbi:MAG: DNA polymerase III subunit delta' [Anaerolineaceae bacterium]|nr:DNA polymerase III subunit delta' [Anaerolineaceae bacterium]
MSWDLLGHSWAEKLLQKHIANDDVRHAYLFTGAPGIGRRSLALAFARAINCTRPPSPGEYCGACRVCTQTARMQHPDLSMVTPEEEGGIIKVSQIRNLQHSLALTPYEARYRIALLLNFQTANASAQNALLKTLEEAPAKVILLLTADSADALLPTISSRCEILRLRPIPVELLEKELQTRWHLPAEDARLYAHISNGRTGLALQMANDPEIVDKRKMWADEFFRLLPLNRRDRFAAVDALTRSRDALRLTLQVWLSLARDLLLNTHNMHDQLTNLDYQTEINALNASLSSSQALDMVNEIITTLDNLESNANLRLLLDNLLLAIPRI